MDVSSLGFGPNSTDQGPRLPDDYNSWQETPQSEAFKERLDTEVIVFEGTRHGALLTRTS